MLCVQRNTSIAETMSMFVVVNEAFNSLWKCDFNWIFCGDLYPDKLWWLGFEYWQETKIFLADFVKMIYLVSRNFRNVKMMHYRIIYFIIVNNGLVYLPGTICCLKSFCTAETRPPGTIRLEHRVQYFLQVVKLRNWQHVHPGMLSNWVVDSIQIAFILNWFIATHTMCDSILLPFSI